MRTALAGALLIATAAPALADKTTGTILAYDRKSVIIVLTDCTGSELTPGTLIPAYLEADERVRVDFTSEGEDGITAIDSLERVTR